MSTPIYLKSSSVASKVPSTSALSLRELGVNTTDGILYLRQGTGVAGDSIIPVNPWKVSVGSTTIYNTYFNVGNVGIGKTNPTVTLDVNGTAKFTQISAANGTGVTGQFLQSTGTGITWGYTNPNSYTRTITYQTATAGQTVFNIAYSIGNIDVYLNGSKLQSSDFVASDGVTVTLNTPAIAGDNIEFDVYNYVTITTTNSLSTNNNVTTTSTTQTTLLSLSATTYRSVDYTIQSTQGTNYKISKILLAHDGTNAYISEQNTILIGTDMSTYDANISGGNINLLVTPTSSSSTTFQVVATAISI